MGLLGIRPGAIPALATSSLDISDLSASKRLIIYRPTANQSTPGGEVHDDPIIPTDVLVTLVSDSSKRQYLLGRELCCAVPVAPRLRQMGRKRQRRRVFRSELARWPHVKAALVIFPPTTFSDFHLPGPADKNASIIFIVHRPIRVMHQNDTLRPVVGLVACAVAVLALHPYC